MSNIKTKWRSAFASAGSVDRPVISGEFLIVLMGLTFSLLFNGAFWASAVPSPLVQWKLAFSLFLIVTALHCLLLGLVLNRWIAKPVLTVLILITALATHYMSSYGVYLDADMLRNVLHTDANESRELLTLRLLIPITLSLFPIAMLWWVKLKRRSIGYALLVRFIFLFSTSFVVMIGVLISSRDVSSLLRSHREIRYLVTPANYLVSLSNVLLASPPGKKAPLLPIGEDAKQNLPTTVRKPRLVVLVVGETVRAQNWGLNGYARQTTPELSRIPGVINFRNVVSCGSSTEVSLPCMFSPYGRANYNEKKIRSHQSLLHVLDRAGVQTLWIDNQSGCKGVCSDLPVKNVSNASDPLLCNGRRCLDEILVKSLSAELSPTQGDRLIVLHQLGNHGPNYFERYPAAYKRFLPTCENSELGQCTVSSIVNAYDNAILYTDNVLSEIISLLDKQANYDTAMIYVSDHGESLGENGLFLHGMPFSIAPKEQIRVPMVMWLSPGLMRDAKVSSDCLGRVSQKPASHDNLFPSILGLMDIQTSLYSRPKDLFSTCRQR